MLINYTILIKLIRRRVVLGLIFFLSSTYCLISIMRTEKSLSNTELEEDIEDNDFTLTNEDVIDESLLDLSLTNLNTFNDTDLPVKQCRNSIQGRILIVDELGNVCSRIQVATNGCCTGESKERYTCKTCNPHGCCAIYEYCVSCCLHPARTRKKMIHRRDGETIKSRIKNLDQFQTCLAVCRTSSASVRHETTYKDPHSKHCYYYPSRQRRDLYIFTNNNENNDFSLLPIDNPVTNLIQFF